MRCALSTVSRGLRVMKAASDLRRTALQRLTLTWSVRMSHQSAGRASAGATTP